MEDEPSWGRAFAPTPNRTNWSKFVNSPIIGRLHVLHLGDHFAKFIFQLLQQNKKRTILIFLFFQTQGQRARTLIKYNEGWKKVSYFQRFAWSVNQNIFLGILRALATPAPNIDSFIGPHFYFAFLAGVFLISYSTFLDTNFFFFEYL